MRDWVTNVDDTFYIIGTGRPHPYPAMVRDFQAVIGREARAQMLERTGSPADALVACVGGGSNAIGLFHPFIDDAGSPSTASRRPATGSTPVAMPRRCAPARPACCTAEHALLKAIGRVSYISATDDEALDALRECCAHEGILSAIETAHAFAGAREWAKENPNKRVLIGLSGRGDKDMPTLSKVMHRKPAQRNAA
jgi:tryptophan synthase beta chain